MRAVQGITVIAISCSANDDAMTDDSPLSTLSYMVYTRRDEQWEKGGTVGGAGRVHAKAAGGRGWWL